MTSGHTRDHQVWIVAERPWNLTGMKRRDFLNTLCRHAVFKGSVFLWNLLNWNSSQSLVRIWGTCRNVKGENVCLVEWLSVNVGPLRLFGLGCNRPQSGLTYRKGVNWACAERTSDSAGKLHLHEHVKLLAIQREADSRRTAACFPLFLSSSMHSTGDRKLVITPEMNTAQSSLVCMAGILLLVLKGRLV